MNKGSGKPVTEEANLTVLWKFCCKNLLKSDSNDKKGNYIVSEASAAISL